MHRSSVLLIAMLGIATSGEALAQSPASTEVIEKWNAEGREQVRRLEAEKAKAEQRERERRLKALKENAELHERIRKLQTEINQLSSPSQMPAAPNVQWPAPQSTSTQAAPSEVKRTPATDRKASRQDDAVSRRDTLRQNADKRSPQVVSPPQLPMSRTPEYAIVETIALKSVPEGATAQTSLGGACETPCLMEVSTDRSFSVTFSHRGYRSNTVDIHIRPSSGVSDPKLTPNPVYVELVPTGKQ